MAKSQQTFNKSEKEKKRLQKMGKMNSLPGRNTYRKQLDELL